MAAEGIEKPLGEVLLESGSITQERLNESIRHQRWDRLKSCNLFSGMTDDDIMSFRNMVYEKSIPAGENFIPQDTGGDSFYVLVEGKALVYRQGEFGEEIPLETIGSGECLGEMGYFSDGRRTASVRTLEDSQLLKKHARSLKKTKMMIRLVECFYPVVSISWKTRLRLIGMEYGCLRKNKNPDPS